MEELERERALLLVDDEENILSSLTRLLRREKYTIYRASSGQEGIEILKTHTHNRCSCLRSKDARDDRC